MTPIRTILHPTDFSPRSAVAFRMACSLARDFGARMVVVHVQPPAQHVFGELAPLPADREAVAQCMREQLSRVVPDPCGDAAPSGDAACAEPRTLLNGDAACAEPPTPLTEPRGLLTGLPVEYRLLEGDPARTILETARETGCDLIVMGTHGRSGLGRFLMGSVAERVLRKAPCPVLTLKAPVPTLATAATEERAPAAVG
jgi:nucleotide-binding universal stress UspA family protein